MDAGARSKRIQLGHFDGCSKVARWQRAATISRFLLVNLAEKWLVIHKGLRHCHQAFIAFQNGMRRSSNVKLVLTGSVRYSCKPTPLLLTIESNITNFKNWLKHFKEYIFHFHGSKT